MKRLKMLPSLIMLVLCFAVLSFGIYSLSPSTHNISGTIKVNSARADVKIECMVNGVTQMEETGRKGINWEVDDLTFDANNADDYHDVEDIVVTLKITNNSQKELGAYFSASAKTENATSEDILLESAIKGTGTLASTTLATAYFKSYSYIAPTESALAEADKKGYNVVEMSFILRCEYIADVSITASQFTYCLNIEEYSPNVETSALVDGASDVSGLVKIPADKGYTKIGDSAFLDNTTATHVVIPSTVTVLGDEAFSGSWIDGVSLPNSITEINYDAFVSTGLKSVFYPKSLNYVPNYAFQYCSCLKAVSLPNNITYIGVGAFSFSAIEKITLPSGLKRIASETFVASSLVKIEIPEEATYIGEGAFSCCESLKNVTLPSTITEISVEMFYQCTSLKNIEIPESVTYIGTGAFDESAIENINLTNVEYIGSYAFSNNSNLRMVTLNEGVLSMGDHCFTNCTGLTTIKLPSTLEYMGVGVLNGCTNLTYNTYENGKYIAGGNNLYFALLGAVDNTVSEFTIHANCKYLLQYALANNNNLTTVVLPDGILGMDAPFVGCSNLILTDKTNSHGYLGTASNPYYALVRFNHADNSTVTSFSVNSNTKILDTFTFKNYFKLTSVTLPSTLNVLPGRIFYGCKVLQSVDLPNVKYMGEYALYYTGISSITLPTNLKVIPMFAFNECRSLNNLVIPSNITNIDYQAFLCSDSFGNLKTITIESADIYNKLSVIGDCGWIAFECTTIKVLTSIVNDTANFCPCLNFADATISVSGNYTVYTIAE